MTSILARAVIIDGERLLVARCRGSDHFFLPGGHLEPGESMHEGLKRELHEELGVECSVGNYLGRLPHTWERRGSPVSETNHCFVVSLADHDVTSKEEHLEFTWLPVSEIPSTDLRPPALRELIPRLVAGVSAGWDIPTSGENLSLQPMPAVRRSRA